MDFTRVYCYKNGGEMKTTFSSTNWKNMGTNKNGWIQYNPEDGIPNQGGDAIDNAPADTKAKMLMANGKGFEQDGKFTDALAKYKEALAIDASPSTKSAITRLEKKIAKATNEAITVILVTADKAFKDKDFGAAFEHYTSALELAPEDEFIIDQIKICEEQIG